MIPIATIGSFEFYPVFRNVDIPSIFFTSDTLSIFKRETSAVSEEAPAVVVGAVVVGAAVVAPVVGAAVVSVAFFSPFPSRYH